MKARRTHASNQVFRLAGGTEDNDLWVERCVDARPESPSEGAPILASVWKPTDEERERIAGGENVALLVWGEGHPPVAMKVTDVPLGAPLRTEGR